MQQGGNSEEFRNPVGVAPRQPGLTVLPFNACCLKPELQATKALWVSLRTRHSSGLKQLQAPSSAMAAGATRPALITALPRTT